MEGWSSGRMGKAAEDQQAMEALARRASALREGLQRSQGNTDSMVAILDSVDHRFSAMRPTEVNAHAIQMANENIGRTIDVVNTILSQFSIARQAEAIILRGPREDLKGYLEAVDLLKGVSVFCASKNFNSRDGFLYHVNNLLSKSVLIIEEEFKWLMSTYSNPIEPVRLIDCFANPQRASKGEAEAGGGNSTHSEHPSKSLETAIYGIPTLISPRVLPLLHDIAQHLVQAGNQQSCYRIYRDARGSAFELNLQKLGVEKLCKNDIQRMPWEAFKAKVGIWTHFMRILVKLLLAGEQKICDQVFDGISFNKDQCCAEMAGTGVLTLLSFGDAIAKSKRSPEKLFALLDMYEVMHQLKPEIEVIFQGSFCSEMRESSLGLMKQLVQTVRETFVDFEEAVERDTSTTITHDGAVHSLTCYVINYVKSISNYQSTLKLLFQEFETGADTESQLAIVTMKIAQALQNNLDGKSKQYKDPALMYIFLMNNTQYMVRSVRGSGAKDILGDDWIQRYRRIVQQNASQYRRVAWAKSTTCEAVNFRRHTLLCIAVAYLPMLWETLQTLSVQTVGPTGSPIPNQIPRAIIKERFKSFNMQFEELHAKQSLWTIPDQELRETLRLAVAEVLFPAYRYFVTCFGNLLGKNPHKYFKYSLEDVEQLLSEFFGGQQFGEQNR